MAKNCVKCGRNGGKNGKNLRNALCGDCSSALDNKDRRRVQTANRINSKKKK